MSCRVGPISLHTYYRVSKPIFPVSHISQYVMSFAREFPWRILANEMSHATMMADVAASFRLKRRFSSGFPYPTTPVWACGATTCGGSCPSDSLLSKFEGRQQVSWWRQMESCLKVTGIGRILFYRDPRGWTMPRRRPQVYGCVRWRLIWRIWAWRAWRLPGRWPDGGHKRWLRWRATLAMPSYLTCSFMNLMVVISNIERKSRIVSFWRRNQYSPCKIRSRFTSTKRIVEI